MSSVDSQTDTASITRRTASPGTAPARVQNDYFQPLLSGRESEEDYDPEDGPQVASTWLSAAAHHVDAAHHANAQSAAGQSTIDVV